MAWGSFLIGGLCFGLFFFVIGGAIGTLLAEDKDGIIAKLLSNKLSSGESLHFSIHVSKYDDSGDDDDDIHIESPKRPIWENN